MAFKIFATAALTSLSNTLSYIKFLFSDWHVENGISTSVSKIRLTLSNYNLTKPNTFVSQILRKIDLMNGP